MKTGSAGVPERDNVTAGRWRRAFPLALLLLLTLIMLGLIGIRTMRAIADAHRRDQLRPGAATSVRPWMSIDYIAANYGVPQAEILATLHLTDTPRHHRVPLEGIARRENRDLNSDIAAINALIAAQGTPHPAPARPPITPGPPTPQRTAP